jgi:hypothetical protein
MFFRLEKLYAEQSLILTVVDFLGACFSGVIFFGSDFANGN